jgi:hypothetical protein
MSFTKSFADFISESEDFLFEGKYDRLVGQISADAMKLVKDSNTPNGVYDGVKIRYTEKEEVPDFNDLIDDMQFLDVGNYLDPDTNLDVFVKLVIVRDEDPVYPQPFILDGNADEEPAILYIELTINPASEPQCYIELAPEMRNLIRHEIEHLTQRGWNMIPSKSMKRNYAQRIKIQADPGIYYKYYKLKDEVDANLHGIYAEAKTRKIPFSEMIVKFLDDRIAKGIVPGNKKREIYTLYKNRSKKIGGLPDL